MFISYARRDFLFVRDVVKQLREAGLKVWLDVTHINVGNAWQGDIEAGIKQCTHCLVVLSPYAIKSGEVQHEIDLALANQKTIIPLLLQTCRPPENIKHLQWVDFRVHFESSMAALLKRLQGEAPVIDDLVLPQREFRFLGFVPLLYKNCPTMVKVITSILYASGCGDLFVNMEVVVLRPSEDAVAVAISEIAAVVSLWGLFRAANRKMTPYEAAFLPVCLAIVPGFAFLVVPDAGPLTQGFRWFHLATFLIDMAMLPVILRSRTFRRWMAAYPFGWGWRE